MQGAEVNFDKYFSDSTLRLDAVISGKEKAVNVSLKNWKKGDGWWGRRINMASVPLQGNAQLIMTTQESGDTIYMLPFSTLFQEWLTTEEADKIDKAMDLTFLAPLPKIPVNIEINLFDNRRQSLAKHVFPYLPNDQNIRVTKYDSENNYEYIWKGGDSKEVIDIAILGEGYNNSEMPLFMEHAHTAVESILDHEPFKSNKDRFNFIAVETPATQSGVSVPQKNQWVNSTFSSQYNTFYSPRYLTTTNTETIHDALRGIPYEHIIILANEDTYGGGGIFNFYALTTARNKEFKPVVVHEFGHSFAGLADEYFYESDALDQTYPLDVEPWERNISTLIDVEDKWIRNFGADYKDKLNQQLSSDGIGVFEGGGYRIKGIYRPTDVSCRMRFNSAEAFCPVCISIIQDIIDFYTIADE